MKAIVSLAIIVLLFVSACEPGDRISSPDKLSGLKKVTFKYDYLNSIPQYYQSLMMTGNETELYIYGAYGGFFVYDLSRNDWRSTFSSYSDTVSWRWDGAIGYLGGKVYVIATPSHNVNIDSFPKYYNIIEADPITGSITALPELLPFRTWDSYPAYGSFNNKIAVIFPRLDSVYVFDSISKKGKFVAQNILKVSSNGYWHFYSYGMNNEYLYVYKTTTKEFYRFSLQSYNWEKIEINSQILSAMPTYTRGGMFRGLFCLWGSGLNVTLVFNTLTGKWVEASIDIPNYDFIMNESSFFATSNALYVVEVFSRNLWRITLVDK
ncbi:MAG: hypothetical protein M1391_08470 [Bacteroidetes bacterium]|nr:hypothetical protein [Bacteroidota bacterium]